MTSSAHAYSSLLDEHVSRDAAILKEHVPMIEIGWPCRLHRGSRKGHDATDGTEASHMRTLDEVNCSRGYEWPHMREAVRRNLHIQLYGLPWGFAG